MVKNGQMLSIKEVADMLNVSQKTIRRHINSGKIQSLKIGGIHRISSEEISTLLKVEKISKNQKKENFPFPHKIPDGPLQNKWNKHKPSYQRNPGNQRK